MKSEPKFVEILKYMDFAEQTLQNLYESAKEEGMSLLNLRRKVVEVLNDHPMWSSIGKTSQLMLTSYNDALLTQLVRGLSPVYGGGIGRHWRS